MLSTVRSGQPRHVHNRRRCSGRVARPAVPCACNDPVFAVVVRPLIFHLVGSICALVLPATFAPPGLPLLAVSCAPLADLFDGSCAAVTTNYGNCTQCPAGYFNDKESNQDSSCDQCPTGYYSGGYDPNLLVSLESVTPLNNAIGCVWFLVCPNAIVHVAGTGSSGCTACDVGHFASVSGLAQCETCAPGRYASTVRSVGCEPCGFG